MDTLSLCVHKVIKKRYVAHIRNIKHALKYDLKLKKVCKAIVFHQKAWLKLYVKKNTKYRKKMTLRKIYLKCSITLYLVRVCGMLERIEILSL